MPQKMSKGRACHGLCCGHQADLGHVCFFTIAEPAFSGAILARQEQRVARQWWHTHLIPALGRQVDLCEFKASLVYIASSKTASEVAAALVDFPWEPLCFAAGFCWLWGLLIGEASQR